MSELIKQPVYFLNTIVCTLIVIFILVKTLIEQNGAEYYRHFRRCLFFTLFIDALEMIYACFRLVGFRNTAVIAVISALRHISVAYLCYLYYRFFRRMICYGIPRMRQKERWLGKIPFFIASILAILSSCLNSTSWVYYITWAGKVEHGSLPLYAAFTAICYGYILYGIIWTVIKYNHNNEVSARRMRHVIISSAPMILLSLLHVVFGERPYICISASLFMLIMYYSMTDELIAYDTLSNLPNKYMATDSIARRLRAETPFYLLMFDVNHFKSINDTYGHDAGDKVIRGIGEVLLEAWKVYNAEPSRYGGDEFCIICEDEPDDYIEHIRKEIAKIHVANNFTVTISIGVCMSDNKGLTAAELLRIADDKMYEEKKKRDR